MSDSGPIGLLFDDSELAAQPFFARRLAPVPPIDAPTVRDDVRAMARRGWEDRTRSEYRGVVIVRRFHELTIEVNAPADVQELALSMLLQEQQHARFCMAAARSLGSDGEVAFEPDELAQRPSSRPATERLLETVVGTYCVGEVVALALIRHALRVLPPSPYREILRRIARDEVLHARIGAALLGASRAGAAWLPWPGDEAVLAMWREATDVMRRRDVIEPDEAAMFEDPEAARQLTSVGIPPSRGFQAAYHRALDGEVARLMERVVPVRGR